MEVPVDQIFQEAIAAHKSGDLEEAKRLYSSILKVEPTHPRVIHNLGLIDLSAGKVVSALKLFEEAIEENSSIEQFWISYIDTLISDQQFENAKQAIMKGERKGVAKKILHALEQKLMSVVPAKWKKRVEGSSSITINSYISYLKVLWRNI